MVPSSSRQLFVWSLPTLAFLLTLLWYRRRRRTSSRSDPGGTIQDTGSTLGDQIQQEKDLHTSTTGSLPTEKQLANTEQLCQTVTIAQSGIKLQIDKHKAPIPMLKGEQTPETSHQHTSELVLMEVMPETARNACPGFLCEAVNHGNEVQTKNHIQDVSTAGCPVDKLDQELCVEKITEKSVMKEERKIPVLEGSASNSLENPQHSIDKISETISSPSQVEEKEVGETENKNLSASVSTNISPNKSSESSHLLPEVNVLCTSDSLKRTAYKQNTSGGDLEALPLNKVTSEEISRMLPVSDIKLQQNNRDTSVELQNGKSDVQVLSLNLGVPENLKLVDCDEEKDIAGVQLPSGVKLNSTDEKEDDDDASVSSVDSFSVATTVVTCELSTQSFTMEQLDHDHDDDDDDDDDESAEMSTAESSTQGSVSVPLECKLSSLESNRNTTGEASSDAGSSISANETMAGSICVASEQQRTERDSANHSPADVMLASPSISSYSDAQSEVLFHPHCLYFHGNCYNSTCKFNKIMLISSTKLT
jgi:hypothetical protein